MPIDCPLAGIQYIGGDEVKRGRDLQIGDIIRREKMSQRLVVTDAKDGVFCCYPLHKSRGYSRTYLNMLEVGMYSLAFVYYIGNINFKSKIIKQ